MPRSRQKPLSGSKAVIPVRALDFVMYNAKDVRQTRAFYQKLFGFKRGHEWTEFWSEFDTEPLTLCLNGTSKTIRPEWNWMGTPCVALAVDDVPGAIAKCRKRGVENPDPTRRDPRVLDGVDRRPGGQPHLPPLAQGRHRGMNGKTAD
jgi:catechol 2,3-dioxygenase-like lactoylglutathione lyase family enzyme